MGRGRTWEEFGTSLPERVGLLAAVSLSGMTFGRSLMPRTLLGQAVATGLWGAASYGLVTASESVVIAATNAVVRRLDERGEQDASRSQAFGYAAHAVAAGLAFAVEKSLPPRENEHLWRSALRTGGRFVSEAASTGMVALSVLDVVSRTGTAPRIEDRSGTTYRANTPWYGQIGALAAVGGLTSAGTVFLQRRKAARLDEIADSQQSGQGARFVSSSGPVENLAGLDGPQLVGPPAKEPAGVSAALAVGAGAATALALVGFGKAEGALSRGVAHMVRPVLGSHAEYAGLIGKAVGFGAISTGIGAAFARLYHSVEKAGDAVENTYKNPPQTATVSGGPHSLVDFATLAREGRRFVNMALTVQEISDVTGTTAMSPVRAFVGLESAGTPLARAVLMLDEMERLGAFERSVICVASPTGTGYVNPTVTETMEYLTAGDCATVAIQYSLRPSVLSLDRVRIGRESNIALFTLLRRRIARIPAERRPRLVAIGESLGAHTLQDVALHGGVEALVDQGIDRALFVGSPAGSGWVNEWREHPGLVDPDGVVVEVASIAEWNDLPAEVRDRVRYVLLTHHEDPIAKFGPGIMLRRPDWLDPAQPSRPGVPPEMEWWPFLTGFVTLADVINAQNISPGAFEAFGHDYRGDLAQLTRVSFDLPADDALMLRVERALREREASWAARRGSGLRAAQQSVSRQLGGLSSSGDRG